MKKNYAQRFNRSEDETSTILFENTRFFKLFIPKNDVVIMKQKKCDVLKFEVKN